ncbi:adenylyl-sulfate kinase [Methylobacterium sp. J-059]|uniref:adenylyl-sulfate kinase n=1 Tax=Methylobacterium sp. J-059 TaxID=2836643 RepID=UPI001FB9EC49|nr:adenylyl-sulfate kinase [Methylobacterium sp. J-059]MCJ2042497.1 adenylyl-sulfate kinase [Methylobacterium sp. J-059]
MSTNLTPHVLQPCENRWIQSRQRPVSAWFTGLSGSGKSSLANAVDQALTAQGRHTMLLDGDNLRTGLTHDLGFSPADHDENVRRIAEAAALMAEAGLIVLVSTISPLRAERVQALRIGRDLPFPEVFVSTPLAVCESRDPKGLYRRARTGQTPSFTGISAPYEPLETPDLTLVTENCSVAASAEAMLPALLCLSDWPR